MKRPAKPNKPRGPLEPKMPEMTVRVGQEVSVYQGMSLGEILGNIKEGVDLDDTEFYVEQGYYDSQDYSFRYSTMINDPNYEQKVRNYKGNLKRYALQKKKHEKALETYEEKLAEYNAWLNADTIKREKASLAKLKEKYEQGST